MDEDALGKVDVLSIALEVPANTGYAKFRASTQDKVLKHLINVQGYHKGTSARGLEAVIMMATDLKTLAKLKRTFSEWKEPKTASESQEATVIIILEGRNVPQQAMFEAALANFGPLASLRRIVGGNGKAIFQQPAAAAACLAAQRIFVGGTAYRVRQLGASRPATCSAWLHGLPRGTTAFELQATMLEAGATHWVVYRSPQGASTVAWARVDFTTEADRQVATTRYFQHKGRECHWSLDLVCVSCGSADHKGKDCSKAPKPAPRLTFGTANRPSQPPIGIRYSDAVNGPITIPSAAPKPTKAQQTLSASKGPATAKRQDLTPDLMAYIDTAIDKAVKSAVANALKDFRKSIIDEAVDKAVQVAVYSTLKAVKDNNFKAAVDSDVQIAVQQRHSEVTSQVLTALGQDKEYTRVPSKPKKAKREAASVLPITEADLEVIAQSSPARQTPITRPRRKLSASTSSETSVTAASKSLEVPPTFDLKSGFLVSSLPLSSDEDLEVPGTADLSSDGSP
jgi:hypothetical protein